MNEVEQKKQAERIVNFLKALNLDSWNVVEVRIGKRREDHQYTLELHYKDKAGFIMLTMQLPEVI